VEDEIWLGEYIDFRA